MMPESRFLSRRDLLAGLAAATTLALTGRLAGASAGMTPDDNAYAPFKVGLQSYSLRHYKLAEALSKTKQVGVHYWESYSAHTNPDPAKAAEYKKMAADAGVTIGGFGVSAFSKNHDANRKYFEFGKALGVDYLSADPDKDAFDSLDKLVEEYGIAIGIHPHGPGPSGLRSTRSPARSRTTTKRSASASIPVTSSAPSKIPSVRSRSSANGSTASTSRTSRTPRRSRSSARETSSSATSSQRWPNSNTTTAWRSNTRKASPTRSPTSSSA